MSVRADLVPAEPVCDDLADNLHRFMATFASWFKRYKAVRILGSRRPARAPRAGARVGVFFTGGVDSFHTLLTHRREITDIIYVHGFDVALDDHARRAAVSRMCRDVGAALGKRVVEIETNAARFVKDFGGWGEHGHGTALAAAGHLLSTTFAKIYVASSFHRDALFPWGSHPATDPLLGGKELELVHDGCEARRTEKIESLGEHPVALRHLRVCWKNVEGAYNCGRCEKCLRTMITLHALARLPACGTLPHRIDPSAVRALRIALPSEIAFARENLLLLEERGLGDSPIHAALKAAMERPPWLARTRAFLFRHRAVARALRSGME